VNAACQANLLACHRSASPALVTQYTQAMRHTAMWPVLLYHFTHCPSNTKCVIFPYNFCLKHLSVTTKRAWSSVIKNVQSTRYSCHILMKSDSLNTFSINVNIKFHKNPSGWSPAASSERTRGRAYRTTDMTHLTVRKSRKETTKVHSIKTYTWRFITPRPAALPLVE